MGFYKVDQIEGIGPTFRAKLALADIETTQDLLERCCSKSGRKEISGKSGINETQLLKWANMADLMRISGVGRQFSELLEASGVDTVKELRNRNADNLSDKMREINEAKKLAKSSPSVTVVSGWINEAKTLDEMISH